MLILSRNETQSIVIGEDPDITENITITVLSVRGKQVRIGITAPGEVPVHRIEIWEKVTREAAEAKKVASP